VTTPPTDHEFTARARSWLEARCEIRSSDAADIEDVSVFHSLPHDQEAAVVRAAAQWQTDKLEAGFAAISWPAELGGAGLGPEEEHEFARLERTYATPPDHELRRITSNLVAPAIRDWGSDDQRRRFVIPFLKCEELVCQLFSEPGAGSDLANVATRASAENGRWRVNGQKVWVSGAQFADWGILIARTDPDVPKYAGLTAFLVPMRSASVGVRPIRQMSGGSSFNEVYFDDLVLEDDLRLGEVGDGWRVALAVLSYERGQSGARPGVGASWEQLLALAAVSERSSDPATRQMLVRTYAHEILRALTRERGAQRRDRTGAAGPEGSLGKLLWVQGLTMIGDTAAALIGPSMWVDTAEPASFAWSQQVLGALGFHIAGGSDEVQRNILAERVLGLPPEPRVDREISWRDLQKLRS